MSSNCLWHACQALCVGLLLFSVGGVMSFLGKFLSPLPFLNYFWYDILYVFGWLFQVVRSSKSEKSTCMFPKYIIIVKRCHKHPYKYLFWLLLHIYIWYSMKLTPSTCTKLRKDVLKHEKASTVLNDIDYTYYSPV